MFGNYAIYVGEKIVLATRQKENSPVDTRIWIGTKLEHHAVLKDLFPSSRNLETYTTKTWLLLPEEVEDFEKTAQKSRN